jgi:hypothetical protein
MLGAAQSTRRGKFRTDWQKIWMSSVAQGPPYRGAEQNSVRSASGRREDARQGRWAQSRRVRTIVNQPSVLAAALPLPRGAQRPAEREGEPLPSELH